MSSRLVADISSKLFRPFFSPAILSVASAWGLSHTHTYTSPSLSLSFIHTRTHTLSLYLTLSHAHTDSLSHSLCLSQTLTDSFTHILSLSHTHTHNHNQVQVCLSAGLVTTFHKSVTGRFNDLQQIETFWSQGFLTVLQKVQPKNLKLLVHSKAHLINHKVLRKRQRETKII